MSKNAQQILEQIFNLKNFREGQEAVIHRLLEKKSTLAIFPTGGGKSLCYQLPALLFDGLTLVISPLIALMKDQIDFLVNHNIKAARLDSSLDLEQTRQVFRDLNNGQTKLLYISPEKLSNERFLQSLRSWNISLMAIDEVHCVSEWGHNFRPDYMKIATLAKQLQIQCVLGLTATATPSVTKDIATAFDIQDNDIIQTGFHRPNLTLIVTPSEEKHRKELLLKRLQERPLGPSIVYVTLQKTAMEVASFLAQHNLNAHPYHAGLKTENRNAIQDLFMASEHMIVVATIAFGMGIDKSNIRTIYHYNLPKGLESYTQEIGRAGRDGKESICELLASAEDAVVLENFTYGDTPSLESITSFLDEILNLDPVFDVSIYQLSNNHDIRLLVVNTLLTYLELDQAIQSTGFFFTEFQFQPLKPSQEILSRFDANRADFLRSIFRHAKKAKIWFYLDVEAASQSMAQPRERIIAALNYLEQQGDLILKTLGARQGYRILNAPSIQRESLIQTLYNRFLKREAQDIARIEKMLGFAAHDSCLTQFLLNYFGEEHQKCGHCYLCQGGQVQKLPTRRRRSFTDKDVELVEQIRAERIEALATSRQLARFLCGLSSPMTARFKLRKHPQFGVWTKVSFHQVLAFVEQRF